MRTSQKTVALENIGPILLERSRRAKHLNLSVRPFKGVRVAVPLGISFRQAEIFVRSKIHWIQRHVGKIRQMEQMVRTLSDSQPLQRSHARRYLLDRLDRLAAIHGLTYGRVFLRNQKTRWGSCSFNNNISLNLKLIRLPQELIDYVILHELAHTRIKNHGPGFLKMLDGLIGDAARLDRRLRAYEAFLLW
jgi:predicted metal-dependent hydrolase